MSHFFGGRRLVDGYSSSGVSDHGQLTGLFPDDDHQQYLITSAIRVVDSPTSGINKTGLTAGDVFSIINAGSGAALFIQQTGNTTDADAALDIDNSENTGRGLSVFSTTAVPVLPLVQFSALDESFDEPVLLITHASPSGLALKVLGDGYLSGHLVGPQSVQFTSLDFNPVDIGETGIYVEGDPGIFYFVDKDGRRYTFGDSSNLLEGDGINFNSIDGFTEISVDVNDLYGTGLGVEVGADGYDNLKLDANASMILYDDADNTFVIGNTVQEALDAIDGYFQRSCEVIRIHKIGTDAVDAPFNSVYTLDGYTYDIGQNKLIVAINGLVQNIPTDYTEYSESAIEFSDPLDDDDEVDIIILPCGIGASGGSGEGGGTDTLQTAYDNSPSGAKNINEDDGQITITQLAASGSVLRLISNSSLTTALNIDQSGSGTGATIKSVDETNSSLLIQKDASSRNSIKNSIIIDRTTSHASGGLTGIGSAILTRLESTGTNLFSASRIITGTESAADSIEDTFLAVELSNDGVLQENLRLTSLGNLGLGTTTPDDFKLQIAGDVGPDADNIYNLGSSSLRWKDGYFGPGSVHIGAGRIFVNEADGEIYFERNDNAQFNLLDTSRILGFEIRDDNLQDGYVLSFDAETNTLVFIDSSSGGLVEIPDPYTPPDGIWNIIGGISVRASGGAASSEQYGEGASASAIDSTAVGHSSVSSAVSTVAIGKSATASTTNSIALGASASASGSNSIVIGKSAQTFAGDNILIGNNAFITSGPASGNIVIGHSAGTGNTVSNSVTMGGSAVPKDQAVIILASNGSTNCVAIGKGANALATGTTAIGFVSTASSSGSTAIGQSSSTSGGATDATALGDTASVTGVNGTAVGKSASAAGTDSTAIGRSASAASPGTESTALGKSATANNTDATALGAYATANSLQATAVGAGASAGANNTVAIGFTSNAFGAGAVVVGQGSVAATNSVVLGSNAGASASGAIAIGRSASTGAFANAIAIGENSTVYSNNQGIIGTSSIPINLINFGNVGIGIPPETVQSFNVEIAGSLGPHIDDAYGLGSSSLRWRDGYFSNDLYISSKVRTGINQVYASLNVPVLSADPTIFDDGDIWITDIGDVKKIKIRIGGATYSTTLTLEV